MKKLLLTLLLAPSICFGQGITGGVRGGGSTNTFISTLTGIGTNTVFKFTGSSNAITSLGNILINTPSADSQLLLRDRTSGNDLNGLSSGFGVQTLGSASAEISVAGTIRKMSIGTNDGSAQLFIQNRTNTTPGLVVQGAGGQTGSLLSVRNSAGTEQVGISGAGIITMPQSSTVTLGNSLGTVGLGLDANSRINFISGSANVLTLYPDIGAGAIAYFTTKYVMPSADNSFTLGRTPADGISRWKQLFLGPTGIVVGDGTAGPTITATGTSPNEGLVLTPAGSGALTVTAGSGISLNSSMTIGNQSSGVNYYLDSLGFHLAAGKLLTFTADANSTVSKDTGIARSAAGVVEFNNGTVGTFRDAKVRQLQTDYTNTGAGTTGDQTINKSAGSVNFAAGATTLTVTCSLCSANSHIFGTVATDDATATLKNIVPGAGSFVIKLTAAATAETKFNFFIVDP